MIDSSWGRGWLILRHSLSVFRQYPIFVLPIFVVWIIYASGVLYLKYSYDWHVHPFHQNTLVLFSCIFIFSFTILMSCSLVLEFLQHIEKGRLYFFTACREVITKNMIKIIPLALVWAVIWFLLTVIDALLSKKNNDSDEEFNAENAAATLAGYGQFSLSRAFIQALQKGVRMVMLLILPAIAWNDLGVIDATQKGFSILKARGREFATGYLLTTTAMVIIMLPVILILELGRGGLHHEPWVHFPDYVWVAVIIYVGFAWSFLIYLEQLFMAQLYMWHIQWEKKVADAQKNNLPLPDFASVEKPSLLANAPDLFG